MARSNSSENWTKHPTLYLKDGSIVLLANTTLFKVYHGLLSFHSEVFCGMMEGTSTLPADEEKYDGCPIVRISDDPTEFACFLKALMDMKNPVLSKTLPFPEAAAILRLSRKYIADSLREQVVKQFESLIPRTFVSMGNIASYTDVFGPDPSHWPASPLVLLSLFQEQDLPAFLPWMYYSAASEPLSSIVKAHFERQISDATLYAIFQARDKLCERWRKIGFNTIMTRSCVSVCHVRLSWLNQHCLSPKVLDKWAGFKALAALSPGQNTVTFQREANTWVQIGVPCGQCRLLWLDKEMMLRRETWMTLPSYFGLPSWKVLWGEPGSDDSDCEGF
ncbi:hypothetical protein M422DRAFT_35691 [Sphaerobolus stellatus SS14]|uniref:Unplaced genomic scaffold SPHSTscaffold_146, whole genome shotgun sequence n=1 Tax=Sphaerobolus stellatus (strain SS14) TaxID=990650 RepID=A0A0C9UU64_SPHS4|nr:hypothetical protein M422DRAFT_35691 [Sphaerobolus stellatus SS14]